MFCFGLSPEFAFFHQATVERKLVPRKPEVVMTMAIIRYVKNNNNKNV